MHNRILITVIILFSSISYAQEFRTGEFKLKASPKEVLGEGAIKYNKYFDLESLVTWEIYVSENYNVNKPAGVMIAAGAPRNVIMPNGWRSVFEDKNLIWIAALNTNNASTVDQKVILAMMSLPVIEKKYNIDKNRIFLTGEGRTAARTFFDYPEMFDGAIFMGGMTWDDNADDKIKYLLDKRFFFGVGYSRNFTSPRTAAKQPQGFSNIVFHGYNVNTSNVEWYRKFKKAGVKNAIRMIKTRSLRRANFAKAIDYLDGHNFPKRLTQN